MISILILHVLGSTLALPLVQLDFELRKTYIMQVLCINKDKPITRCAGSCYLESRIRAVSQQADHQQTTITKLQEILFFNQSTPAPVLSNIAIDSPANQQAVYLQYIPQWAISDIFEPPRQA